MKQAIILPSGDKVMYGTNPACEYESCNGNKKGRCTILTDTKFDRPCPFYKRKKARQ